MSILNQAKKQETQTKIVTICGNPGSGKDTTASTWPQPSFIIQTVGENQPDDIPIDNKADSLGVTSSYKSLMQQLRALYSDEHEYKTVIISTVTGLETMFSNEVVENDPKATNIQQAAGGYGAGRDVVAGMHTRVGRAAEALRNKGIHVVFLAHSDIVTISPPDGEPYTSWSLRMHSKSMSAYTDNVDVVGFIKQDIVLVGDDKKKRAKTTGDRTFVCTMTPSAVAKNRLGITEDILITQGKNPLAPWLGLGGDKSPVHNDTAKDDGVEFNEEEGN